MAEFVFKPSNTAVSVGAGCKILVAARQGKIKMRYGCVSCRCGTCAVKVEPAANLIPMADDERALLASMNLPTGGSIRLGCQTRIKDGQVKVDLDFQAKYSPDKGILE